jgi:hypothetical protein
MMISDRGSPQNHKKNHSESLRLSGDYEQDKWYILFENIMKWTQQTWGDTTGIQTCRPCIWGSQAEDPELREGVIIRIRFKGRSVEVLSPGVVLDPTFSKILKGHGIMYSCRLTSTSVKRLWTYLGCRAAAQLKAKMTQDVKRWWEWSEASFRHGDRSKGPCKEF